MMNMLMEMRDRMKSRVGIYSTGWNPASVMGVVLPLIVTLLLLVVGFAIVHTIHSVI